MIARSVLCSLFALALSACSPADKHAPGGATHAASITGSVLDAQSGEPLEGVRVEGPRSTHASSDSHGRFVLDGLVEGDHGAIVARTKEGRTAQIEVRALAPGALEIVLHMR